MIANFVKSIFGSRNDRLLKQYRQSVREINALEAGMAKLSNEELQKLTAVFKQRFTQGESLDALLPEEIGRAHV